MDKTINRFSHIVKTVINSGMGDGFAIETIRKVQLLNVISLTGVICLIPLGLVAYLQGNTPLAIFDFFTAIILLLNLLYLKRSHNYQFACFLGIAIAAVLFFYLLVTGGVNNTGHLWYYTFPLFSAFLLGFKKGAAATIILFILAVIFFSIDLKSPDLTHYSKDFIIRFIPSFLVVFIYSYAFEYFREKTQKKLTSKNDELNRIIIELKKTDAKLRIIQEDLEQRVQERAGELLKTTIELTREIKSREESEEERSRLQAQLAHAKKMEAIGTLAGGVAHDLNNVLSASICYPDLILLDLPEDSPLRDSIIEIQKSGQKAAAIVNDLLTLARRGVVATQVTHFNEVIKNYLDSPEFGKLMDLHPDIKIKTHLDPELWNIVGSPFHLSQTVMNLVTNAAESIDGSGEIVISTENRSVDKPIKGYTNIKEGEYVIFTVSDTGTGISEEDLERIFEPFFSKKILGRSGSGLGLAVVWGTVKDHNGHIDIHSYLEKGTRFTLYFPVTEKEMGDNSRSIRIEAYMGKGESILVVDDIEDQRKIATNILTKLNYTVRSTVSGEEAVDYLKNHTADLVILDMIMNPGMDGLDTYKKIIETHPGQKAIITSGFSPTARVKELQNIGAGAYIKKPYTIEKIGIAVKAELEDLPT